MKRSSSVAWDGERKAHRSRALLALLLALGWAPALRADFRESFKKGIEAVDRKEWSAVARWMREAAAEKPQEGESVKIYGVRFEPYLPHFYLGLALFQSGDCEGALEQWQESERQRAVQGTSRFKLLVQNRDTCRQRIAAKAPPPPPVPSGPDPAAVAQAAREAEAKEAAKEAARRRQQEQEAESARLREAESRRKQQEQEAEAARVRDAEARRRQQEQEAAEAAQVAEEARQAEANRERAARQELANETQRAAADAKAILDRAARSPRADPDLARRQKTLRDLLRKAASAGGATSLAELARLRDGLSASAASLEAALLKAEGDSGPPAELRAAARAFFRADYEEVVRRLGKSTFPDRRATLASHLLLAAARYSLYLEGGEKDERLRRQATESVRACRRTDPKVLPDGKAFSPRFMEFFKTVG
jgi:chemotaxis protein histidine kinase CheA